MDVDLFIVAQYSDGWHGVKDTVMKFWFITI